MDDCGRAGGWAFGSACGWAALVLDALWAETDRSDANK